MGTTRGTPALRRCSRTACPRLAAATLTYVYADSTAVIGPLAASPEPHCYDLCEGHAATLTTPRGWRLIRAVRRPTVPAPVPDGDLLALADAVREAPPVRRAGLLNRSRARGHLRLVPPPAAG